MSNEPLLPEDHYWPTWREMISAEMRSNKDSFCHREYCTVTDEVLAQKFDAYSCRPSGVPFVLWTTDYVYFSHDYDGMESVQSVPRHPGKFVGRVFEFHKCANHLGG